MALESIIKFSSKEEFQDVGTLRPDKLFLSSLFSVY